MTMIRSRFRMCVLSGAVLVGLAGCGFRDRDNTGGELSPEVKQAIDDVVAQFTPAAEAFAAFFAGFEGIDLNGDGQFGTCPVGTAVVNADFFSITLDYGDGCTNEYYGNDVASGSVLFEYDRNAQSVLLEYTDLMVADRAVNGSLDLAFTTGEGFRTLDGSIDLTTNSGTVGGSMDMRFGLALSTITINSATLTLTDTAQTSYMVTMNGLVIKPVANGSFIPESGTITFEVPNDGPGPDTLTIVVTFSNLSPVNGRVSVTVAGAAAVIYYIPGVG